jgi:O-antigen/teichoic acid export membrane protein
VARRDTWREQLAYALPLGLAGALYVLRTRVDQWLVASMHLAANFGMYSVAAVFNPVQGLTRTAINQAVLPELNRLHQQGQHTRMRELNHRANLGVALLMWPFAGFVAVCARPLLELLFGPAYGGSALAMQLYMAMLAIEAIEVSTLLIAYGQSRFMLATEAVMLVAASLASLVGLHLLGLNGAALGALVAVMVAAWLSLRRCRRILGVSLSELQPWAELSRLLAAACLASVCTALAQAWLPAAAATPWGRAGHLAALALVMALAYWLGLRLLGAAPAVTRALGARGAGWLGLHAAARP